MIFTLNSIHQMSQTFLIQQKIFVFIMTYCRNNIFIHAFYPSLYYAHYYHLPRMNASLALIQQVRQQQHHLFHIFIHFKWIITKIKHFFLYIFGVSVSVNNNFELLPCSLLFFIFNYNGTRTLILYSNPKCTYQHILDW